jgi:non-lysosomal glucosylceramidase
MPKAKRSKVIPWSAAELRAPGAVRTYAGQTSTLVAVPIGGIGTGCVSLGGWGQLQDWEIYGRPGKGNLNEMAFFSLYAKPRGGHPVVKVLQGPTAGPRMGPAIPAFFKGGASGAWNRAHGAGLPHFRSGALTVRYPLAELSLRDPNFPLVPRLTAWNPFIPLNEDDSSIPCAIFQWEIANPSDVACDATLFMNLSNTIGFPEATGGKNSYRDDEGMRGLFFTTERHAPGSPRFGTMALATSHPRVTYLTHWKRGGWYDPLTDFWAQAQSGALDEGVAAESSGDAPGEPGSLGIRLSIPARGTRSATMVLAWHFPTQEHYWAKPDAEGRRPSWAPWYATKWTDAWDAARYALANLRRLESETRGFVDTLHSTTLPGHVVEAVSATSSILKSPTCLRLTGGEFWGWEGCNDADGCCAGTCTHVWNYQQMLPFLFPRLERGIRETDYAHNLHDNGHMSFRMPLPLGTPGSASYHAAADGQLGGIMKVYRDWRISGDDAWLARLWPSVKRSLQFAWVAWDRDRDGVMEAPQHNTYDIEFWGPNTMCGSFYLGALRAAEEMARALGDGQSAEKYAALFKRGSAWMDAHLWNGEYFVQRVDPNAGKNDLFARPVAEQGSGVDETGAPKYQYGAGCLSDQLLGQLFAEFLELGDLFDSAHIDGAMRSIYRYNWKRELFDHANPQRIYAQDEEPGLLLCTWPRGNPERFPFPYSDEVWTGIEYATAALAAYRGMVDESLAMVKAVRVRHDGATRNPFDEFECGHHYARAMASYAVLLALSGFVADLPHARLALRPRLSQSFFQCFFSVDSGWGLIGQEIPAKGPARYFVDVRYGSVKLSTLSVAALRGKPGQPARPGRPARPRSITATLGKAKVRAEARESSLAGEGKGAGASAPGMDLVLGRAVIVKPGKKLEIVVG